MRKTSLTVAACATLLCAGAALATPTAQEKCDNVRITAWRKYAACVEGLVAKHAARISFRFSVEEFAAFAKCRHAYFKKWTAFQTKASLAGTTCIGTRYTDNGDQTVTDNLTGLVWEKKDNGGGIHDKDNSYTWSTGPPYKENGAVFTNFLDTVNGGGGFAGATGWRLPTFVELQTIVLDFPCSGPGLHPGCLCATNPCIDPVLDSGNTQSHFYWSATSYVPDLRWAWVIGFDDGGEGAGTETVNFYVRVVRGGL